MVTKDLVETVGTLEKRYREEGGVFCRVRRGFLWAVGALLRVCEDKRGG